VPRYPSLSAPAEALPSSIYARLFARASQCAGPVFPFHIGDSYLEPPDGGRLGALGFTCQPDPSLYRYSQPAGDPPLIEALVDKLRTRNRMAGVRAENIQITNGATHALSCATRAVLDPGDEVLLLSPYWPLIRGIALSVAARPVEVPFSHVLLRDPAADIEALLESHVRGRTAAIYVTTPNNPDGKVLVPHELEAIARVARRHDLWVLSDEVYEEYRFDGRAHVSMATLPDMAERTLTAFSFSKTFAQPGLRVGYVVGPADTIDAVRKMANHSVYSVARAMQRAATGALVGGDAFVTEARGRYQDARDRAVARIQAPCLRPEGSTYLFLDLSAWVCDPGEPARGPAAGAAHPMDAMYSLLDELAGVGVLLAPGSAFGKDFGDWARLCYTTVPPDRLDEGIGRINSVLERVKRT
jgi:aspartate/methionine/tyrosine aminotransferase